MAFFMHKGADYLCVILFFIHICVLCGKLEFFFWREVESDVHSLFNVPFHFRNNFTVGIKECIYITFTSYAHVDIGLLYWLLVIGVIY